MSKQPLRPKILYGIVALLVSLLIALLAWVLVAGPQTVFRVLRYGDTQIDDYLYYPSRRIAASSSPYHLVDLASEDLVPHSVVLRDGSSHDLVPLLAENESIAFLVVKGDALLFEQYFQGHSADAISQTFSVSKSFTSALIGAAIGDGLIRDVDQWVTDFVPELAESGFGAVNLRHLLTMTSGSDYVENDNPFGIHVILNYTPKLEKEILGFQIQDEPGTVHRYKSGDNALLALILSRALAPGTIADYTREKLWEPLGMESDGLWSLDHDDGLEKSWCCLAASARDLAKFGMLYLNDGQWQGVQILHEGWVEKSTQAAIPENLWDEDFANIGVSNYGYQWWLASADQGDYFALGKDGQYIYVNPAFETVIVRLGSSQGDLPLSAWLSLFQFISAEID